MDEANLVIKLVEDAKIGYVPVCQLKKQYHEKYGKYLERKNILKWIRTLPGVYVNNDPVTDSVRIGAPSANRSTPAPHKPKKKAKKRKAKMERSQTNLPLDTNDPVTVKDSVRIGAPSANRPTPAPHKPQKKAKKRKAKMERSQTNLPLDTNDPVTVKDSVRIGAPSANRPTPAPHKPQKKAKKRKAKMERSQTNLPLDTNDPVTVKDSVRIGAPSANRPTPAPHKPQKKAKKRKAKMERSQTNLPLDTNDPVTVKDSVRIGAPSANRPTPAPHKPQKKAKKRKAKMGRSQTNLPLPFRSDCYYGMANHRGNSESRRKCIMHFGSTSDCKTKYWPQKDKERLGKVSNTVSLSRAIVSGYIANKVKKAGGQKAARKTRNLARLRKKHNPLPADATSHAKQRYRERGLASSPIYKSLNDGKRAIVMTYIPIQRSDLSDAKNSSKTIQLEVDRMSNLSKKSDLPKSKLSSRDACLFKLSRQATKKEEWRRRSQQKKKAYETQCIHLLDKSWTPLSINTRAPHDIHMARGTIAVDTSYRQN